MKQTLLIIILISCSYWMTAQSLIEMESDLVEVSGEVLDYQITGNTNIYNNSDQPVNLVWEMVQKGDWPQNWENAFYISDECFDPLISSYTFSLDAFASTDLGIHLYPDGTEGCGIVEIRVRLEDQPDEIISSTQFNLCTKNIASQKTIKRSEIRLFPNPASDYFEITSNPLVDQIEVYNLISRKVKSFRVQDGTQYNIQDLPSGIYLVSLINNETGIIKTLRMSKRSMRP